MRRPRPSPRVEPLERRALLAINPLLASDVAAVVDAFLLAHKVPGAEVAVVEGGQVALAAGYGLADLGTTPKTPMTATTPSELGSVTKTYTALGLLYLEDHPDLITETGVTSIDLNAPLTAYMTDLPTVPSPTPLAGTVWADITPYELLTMSSGIADSGSNTLTWQQQLTSVFNQEQADGQTLFTPGTEYLYSNVNFTLLGALIQDLTGLDYATFVQTYIFSPLDLSPQTVVRTGISEPGQAIGYSSYDPATMTGTTPSSYRPGTSSFSAGAISTAAVDAGTYLASYLNQSILQPSTYQQMFAPDPLPGYQDSTTYTPGLGWDAVTQDAYGTQITKNGGIPGYSAQYTL
jgi:CubicO group peptidase (beta-lactamase class C family)